MKDAAFYPEHTRKFIPRLAAEIPGIGVCVEFVKSVEVAMASRYVFGQFECGTR